MEYIFQIVDQYLYSLKMTESLLTSAQVADLLGTSTATVSRWLRNGELPSLRCGARHVFEPRVIKEWMHKQNLAPAPVDHQVRET